MKKHGIRVGRCCTGDAGVHGLREVAEATGIDEVYASLLPAQKKEFVAKYQKEGKIVAMTGDGVNDAASLASADMSIADGQRIGYRP
ncbi:MAG: HAD family hydrolase [Bacteroidales bacterium]|nr:HAD family hydrolase [Bacteroidales bacterium]